MKRSLGSLIKVALPVCLCVLSGKAFAADSDMPLIMTLNTNIYSYQGPTNSFTIYLGSTEENVEIYVESPSTQEYIEINPWTLGQDSDGENAAIATAVALNVTEKDNEVRIYGDKSKIDFIDVHGCYLSNLELAGEFPNLTVIDLSHNELSYIDLSPQSALASIDLTDNSFQDSSKMIIGKVHPDLMLLQVGINDVVDPDLNLADFPNLQYFSARNNYGIFNVDPTNCPELVSLVLEVTNISSIDVSKNPKLTVLNLSQTKVNSVDISNNKNLVELYISHEGSFNNESEYKLSEIDLSNNSSLQYLDLGGNALTSIDLSHNPSLNLLYLQRNRLSEIDLSDKPNLSVVNLSNNYFTFATLPIPEEGWDYYYYRSPLPCNNKYKVGEPIDFLSEVIRKPFTDKAGNTITPVTYANVFGVPLAQDPYEVDADLYTYDNGIVTFKEAIPDSVYVQFYCDVFPDWTLDSSNFKVKTEEEFNMPSKSFSFLPDASLAGKYFSLSLGAYSFDENVAFPVDAYIYINGQQRVITNAITGSDLPTVPNISFLVPSEITEITIALPDGLSASALSIENFKLQNIDLSPALDLTQLKLVNCELSEIDLGFNRNLHTLNLSGNTLYKLDLSGVRADYQKFELTDLDVSNNQLSSLVTVYAASIKNLDLSNNNFRTFDNYYFTGLQNYNISGNKLSDIFDISKVEAIKTLNISNNNIKEIIFNDEEGALDYLTELNIRDNSFSFETLPIVDGLTIYNYAPQAELSILSAGSAINLSKQNIVRNEVGTSFVWKYTNNKEVVAETLYSNNGGAFTFSDQLLGKEIYCEMTNPIFPDFEKNPLTTTSLTVSARPQNLLASFETAENGTAQIGFRFHKEGVNAIYIDWRGDGSEYEPYIYDDSENFMFYRTGECYAGATVKVWSFDSPDNISVIGMLDTPLISADLSPMTQITAIDIHNAGLKDGALIIPESEELFELILDGNSFEKETFAGLRYLTNLNLAENNYTAFDFSPFPKLSFAQLANNRISEVKFDNNSDLIQLDLSANNLSEIDLDGVLVDELILSDNQLKEIDLTPVANYLRVLYINGNCFTFATLPDLSALSGLFSTYSYGNQKPIEVECIDSKIDLSSQAVINGVPTDFYWFLGDSQSQVYYDYDSQSFVGEMLEGPEDSTDPEYLIEDGITTFLYPQSRNVICAMTNSEYPGLILYTTPTKVDMAGVESFEGYGNDKVNVYTLSGIKLKDKVEAKEALKGLKPGIYIINGKKILVK